MIELVTERADFIALEPEWNALAARFASPLLRHELFAAMLEAQGERARPHVLVLRRGGAAAAIAPLRTRRLLGMRRLEFISHDLHEPSGFLYSDGAALAELQEAVRSQGLPLHLGRLLADSAEFHGLSRDLRGDGYVVVTDGRTMLHVPLSADFADLERGISPGARRNLRRLLRKAEGFGPVSFVSADPAPGEVDSHLDEVFRIEASGWKGRARSAILSDPVRAGFFRRYGRALAERGMLRIFLMKIGQDTAAVRLAVAHGDSLWELKIGYDERYRSCSPGILLTHATLRQAAREGFAHHRFLGTAADWERTWPCRDQQCRTLRYYPPAIASLPFLALEGVRAARALPARFAAVPIAMTGAVKLAMARLRSSAGSDELEPAGFVYHLNAVLGGVL